MIASELTFVTRDEDLLAAGERKGVRVMDLRR